MSVEEVIEQIKRMTPEEQALVEVGLAKLRSAQAQPQSDEGPHTVEEAWAMLDQGWCVGDGRPMADTVDEVLYGSGR